MAEMQNFDVLIVGAGLSGICAAAHLTMQCPDKSYTILEQRQDMGGTWDLFRYPGIRFDTDVFTMGYKFKPWWNKKSMADGPDVQKYIQETADDHGIKQNIRFGHRVLSANWSGSDAKWTVVARSEADHVETRYTANFLIMCPGYYDYDNGHRPEFTGEGDYRGTIIHPQHWPEDFDHEGKKIIVIGSGATAVTLVPAMAETAAKVTMLQRSPSYMATVPSKTWLTSLLPKILPAKWAYAIIRQRKIQWQQFIYAYARKNPEKMRKRLLDMARKDMPNTDFDKHFVPHYPPWEQRLCLLPDGDMFKAVESGKADVVTGQIDRFTEKGILLKSGEELEADAIITATGLSLVTMGKAKISVDGEPVVLSERVSYKGVMFNDIPNFASVAFGYINASWTLKAELVVEYICRLLRTMDEKGAKIVNPKLDNPDMPRTPFIENFSAGYLQRSIEILPKNGDRLPWRMVQNYGEDKKLLGRDPVDDGVLKFSNPVAAPAVAEGHVLEVAE